MATELLYGNGTISSEGWTNPANAHSAPDGVNATSTTVGNNLNITLADLSGSADIETSSITFGVRYAALRGTSGRDQSALIELLDGDNTVLYSFDTGTINTATLADFTSTVTPVYNRTQVAALRVRITPQEGGGMSGTRTHYADAVWADVTYEAVAVPETIDVDAQSITITTNEVTVLQDETVAVDTVAIVITANDIQLIQNETVNIDTASISITTNDIEIIESSAILVDAASITITTNPVNVKADTIVDADTASITITTNAVEIQEGADILVDTATITITTRDVVINARETVNVDTTNITIATQNTEIINLQGIISIDLATLNITTRPVTIIGGGYIPLAKAKITGSIRLTNNITIR